jgi:hypothetical protein
MNTKRLQVGILIGGLLWMGAAAADPVSTLLGLMVVDKVSEPQASEVRPYPWRKMLSSEQLATLRSIRHNRAVGTCIAEADNGNPIAAYQARKIAAFSNAVRVAMARNHRAPDVATLRYRRPAKAYSWCARQAGLAPTNTETLSLRGYAERMVSLVRTGRDRPSMLAARVSY